MSRFFYLDAPIAPANIQGLDPIPPGTTVRAALISDVTPVMCVSAHVYFEHLGLPFEAFDARVRTTDERRFRRHDGQQSPRTRARRLRGRCLRTGRAGDGKWPPVRRTKLFRAEVVRVRARPRASVSQRRHAREGRRHVFVVGLRSAGAYRGVLTSDTFVAAGRRCSLPPGNRPLRPRAARSRKSATK
jgi:hypothetical protein